ncbi:MAG: TRAP transporter substrate-binding protein [Sphaerochaeta sp.]|jgi:tripartite ATP-independent transporter DctP family solute receptor|uniref:TRAP transporter substrate-binding protein n=1 Tax=Sphaerochaeta sp. TaxID=1972642 RepID=UPI002FCBD4F7
MKRLRFAFAVLVALLVIAPVFAAGSQEAAASKPMVLKLGHIQSDQDVWHKAALFFAEKVAEKTNGTVKVEVYPNSTIGNDRDMAEGLQLGSVDFALIAGVLGNFEPSLQILELPYLIENEQHLRNVIYGPIGQELFDRLLKSSNIRGLTYWERGPRQLTSNYPINTIADVKGLKLRLPEIPAMLAYWKAAGANPTPMAWGEVYSALQQKVIDGQENPIPYIHSARLEEVQSYIAMTSHKYEYVTISMSNLTYEKLNAEQQKAVYEAASESAEYQNKLVADLTDSLFKDLQAKGMKVTYPDRAPFIAVAQKVNEEFASKIDADLYKRIVAAK